MLTTATVSQRSEKALFTATLPFAVEAPLRSWLHVSSTLVALVAMLSLAAIVPWWPLRFCASVVGGLVLVRVFILYHDVMHGSLLSKARLTRLLFYVLGLLMLAPPRHWRFSHNFHHAHVGKAIAPKEKAFPVLISAIGSFPLMSTERWRRATAWQRLRYRVSRHPLSILSAYATTFLLVSCVNPLVKDPRKYWDGALALLAHGGLVALLWWSAGFGAALFAVVFPFAIASALGAYIFYAQHTFEGIQILPPAEWTYFKGAIESSSYMKLGPLMSWFTGNIGYHHVHHLNSHIPFYRLPEAMAAIPELQHPCVTSLRLRDIGVCFRANLWHIPAQRMVSYHEATHSREGRW